MEWQRYIPSEPPEEGRYLVQRSDGSWEVAWFKDDEKIWRYPDGSGPMTHVWYYLEVTPAQP